MVVIDEDDYLEHYGTPRHSGRYPWGSGDNESGLPRNASFLDIVDDLKRQGLTDKQIYEGMGISSTQYRARKSIARSEKKMELIATAQRLQNKGMSGVAAAAQMGVPESTYRSLLAPGAKDRAEVITSVSNMLKDEVDAKTYIQVGAGVEHQVGVSKERLNASLAILREKGYEVHTIPVQQIGTGKDTRVKVLAPPGTTWGDVARNRDQIKLFGSFSDDGGRTFGKVHDPMAIDPNRVAIRYKEDGGDEADGVIFVRPGVEDVSLGKSRYAQVRIQVGEGHYLKGMAMYKDNLPAGSDILFNTNKTSTGNKLDAMKALTDDPQFPFGSVVRQIVADHDTPDERVTSVMNIVGSKPGQSEEGGWGTWSKSLSSQFLSKQPLSLAKSQLNLTYDRRARELDDINSLTNPTIKKKLLESFADDADSAAVQLKGAALSQRQAWHVILPIDSISPSKIYAPRFRDGETVVLVRYPHGGTFEIPELVVDNKNREGRKLLGDVPDAVGIHHSVATRLSGADFDGDTVIVIPNNRRQIKSTAALERLKGFDPRSEYPQYEGMTPISGARKQQEMGNVSNLITDMTIRGAPHKDIVNAVRHSMVVIDAENHKLDWKRSYVEHGIAQLKRDYQGGAKAGAKTLISRAESPIFLPDRKPRPAALGGPVDRVTGRKEFVETGRTKIDRKTGERVPKNARFAKLAVTDDAHTLSSGTPMERIYADHSNKLKTLANQARLSALKTPRLQWSPSAKKAYAPEVASLNSKLKLAQRNAPLERQAQILANSAKKARMESNPNLDRDDLKKIGFDELEKARTRLGAKKARIEIEPKEWDAIQAGAISNNQLLDILANTDVDVVRKLATPRRERLMTPAKTQRAQAMLASGHYTRAQIADALGVSLTTLDRSTVE